MPVDPGASLEGGMGGMGGGLAQHPDHESRGFSQGKNDFCRENVFYQRICFVVFLCNCNKKAGCTCNLPTQKENMIQTTSDMK